MLIIVLLKLLINQKYALYLNMCTHLVYCLYFPVVVWQAVVEEGYCGITEHSLQRDKTLQD